MRGPFRYISVDKLSTMSSTNRWWRRATLKAGASLPGVASAGATIVPDEANWPARIEQVEVALRKGKRVASAREVVSLRKGMFEFDGPAQILAAADAFWVATATEGVAIVLIGSLKHVVGATPPEGGPPLSMSNDPTPAIRAFLAGQRLPEYSENLDEVWINLLLERVVGDPLPLRGIAEYRSQGVLPGVSHWEEHPLASSVGVGAPLVLGSPLWVEAV